jgi:hypothetical protein
MQYQWPILREINKTISCKIALNRTQYLGITTKETEDLYSENYKTSLTKVQTQISGKMTYFMS